MRLLIAGVIFVSIGLLGLWGIWQSEREAQRRRGGWRE